MRILIFHGWGSTSKDNWFPWLKSELEERGHDVVCPDFPEPQYPNLDAWMKIALPLAIDGKTIMVGHSLGSVLIMRILELAKAKSFFLVSGFDEYLGIKEIEDFFRKDIDYDTIIRNCPNRIMLSSDDDPFIPMYVSERLSKEIAAELLVYPGTKHLSSGTGNLMFPELLEMILDEIDKEE